MDTNWIGLYTFVRREIERVWRIKVQTVAAPLISASLFIFIFGFVLGRNIDFIAGVPYLSFVFPGILTLTILQTAFDHSSFMIYIGRWTKSIHELLVSPFSYIEMVVGFVGSAVTRVIIIGTLTLLIGTLFGAVHVAHPVLFLFVIVGIATVFALVGILVGLWADGFEQLGVLNTFLVTPLTMLGGVFYSTAFLPDALKVITFVNPFFYLIDMMRYVTIGVHESNLAIGVAMIVGLIVVLGALVVYLFKKGWRIRE